MKSRALRRLDRLAEAAAVVKTGAERELIFKTILKILDECSGSEYDIACSGVLREKLTAAGVEFFDAEESFNRAALESSSARIPDWP